MNKHFNKRQLKNFADGNYDLNNLIEISKHLTQCELCKENLLEISPDFFKECADQKEEFRSIEEQKHYSRNEILEFIKGTIPFRERMKMSGHFRNCLVCKTKFYQTDPEILKSYVLSKLNKEDSSKKWLFFQNLTVVAPVGALAVLLIGVIVYNFTFLVRNNTGNDAVVLNDTFSSQININNQNAHLAQNQMAKDEGIQKEATRNSRKEKPPSMDKVFSKNKSRIKKDQPNIDPQQSRNMSALKISPTRNSKEQSSPQTEKFSLKIALVEGTEAEKRVSFIWKQIPQTVKYHVFLTESDQVLIEEGEVNNQHIYTSKTFLQPGKSYKVIVSAIKQNGERIVSHPLYFDLNLKKAIKKEK